jgi:hypothetical protein
MTARPSEQGHIQEEGNGRNARQSDAQTCREFAYRACASAGSDVRDAALVLLAAALHSMLLADARSALVVGLMAPRRPSPWPTK